MRLTQLLTGILCAPFLLAYASPVPENVFPRQAGSIYTKCNRPGVIALTFDDGPGQYMSQLLTTLNNNNVKATFFVTGTLYGCIYSRASLVQSAYAAGHQIGSHTWSHPNLSSMSSWQITTEMQKLETALVNIIGVKPQYMRPPYLSAGGSVQSVMSQLGYRIVNCDVDSEDWNGLTPTQSLAKFQAAGTSGNGHIPLMHEVSCFDPLGREREVDFRARIDGTDYGNAASPNGY
jgi:peptidoglycan/xylan/chitin deacetylase (PgdA/CDA1 family)